MKNQILSQEFSPENLHENGTNYNLKLYPLLKIVMFQPVMLVFQSVAAQMEIIYEFIVDTKCAVEVCNNANYVQ